MTTNIKSYVDNTTAFKAMRWCNSQGIKIYPVALDKKYSDGKYGKHWCIIEIDRQGIKKKGDKWYTQDKKLYNKIFELYLYFYNRR